MLRGRLCFHNKAVLRQIYRGRRGRIQAGRHPAAGNRHGAVIVPAVRVAVEDNLGNIFTGDNSLVKLDMISGKTIAILQSRAAFHAVNEAFNKALEKVPL
jgi:hypothetical protein